MRFLSLLALALLAAAPASAQLSAPERSMAEIVEREQARNVELLERLVNQNSGKIGRAHV